MSDIKYDPIEDTEEYKNIVDELEKKIETCMAFENIPIGGFGTCHIYWSYKKEILKNDYNIDWMSPAELNPTIMFD